MKAILADPAIKKALVSISPTSRQSHKFAAYASEVARQGYASDGKLVNGVDGSEKMEWQFNRKPFGGHMT